MTRREDLTALRERVLAAKGADREIDYAIVCAVFPEAGLPTLWIAGDEEPIFLHAPDWLRKRPAPAYTASIDAALAIVERVLPGWHASLATEWRGTAPSVCLVDPEDNRAVEPWNAEHEVHQEQAPTLPLAILAALLSALISQEQSL